ncbi:tetratricopeptide repeat protein [Fontivita pretiosa]|uniref:tetratricopeptide repeat protein n=1 Tax=Fontivita pretiosa TaxID=2989684 RepID=UPI003D1632F2
MHTATVSRLSVLLVTDIVGSTDLKGRIGLEVYARLLALHDAIFRRLIGQIPGAEILKDTGDGYFASFATTSDAVRLAIQFQHALHQAEWNPQPLRVRVGIHVGEVAQLEKETTGKPKLVGLAADLVARIAHLASGGQILLTRFAFNEARQFISASPVKHNGEATLKWVAHGPYRFRGIDEVVDVFEVGLPGIAPLVAPPGNDDARRAVAADDESTLGWRPAVGLAIPGRAEHWALQRRLGEGAFGEVWLARHTKLGMRRVFKFCFDADRLRNLKREMTLFRLLRETLGERRDIARIHEVKLDEPPYYLESEYTEGGNLSDWAQAAGGIAKIPLETRIELIARVAEAVSAAHSVGVLHKDIKPGNILISTAEQQPRPQLADFGIGMLTDKSRLGQRDITMTGFTQTTLHDASSRSGTQLYMPPELLRNQPFTVKGDIYALGVLLYQVVVGDLTRPLAEGWQRDVHDPLLQEDIASCVQGDPDRRLDSAATLAARLRALPQRREQIQRQADEQRSIQRRRKLARAAFAAAGGMLLVVVFLLVSFYHERSLRQLAQAAQQEAERQRNQARAAHAREADQRAIADAVGQFLMSMLMRVSPDTQQGRDVTVMQALDIAAKQLDDPDKKWHPEVEAYLRHTVGNAYRVLGEPKLAEPNLRKAAEMLVTIRGEDSVETHQFRGEWAKSLADLGEHERAVQVLENAVRALEQINGPDDDSTLGYMDDWAQNLLIMNRLDEAEPIVKRLVDARRRLHGPDHEQTLGVMNTYGGLLFERGQYAQALEQFRAVADARARVNGEDHALTLVARQNLASLIYRTGNVKQGAELMQAVVEGQKRAVGPEHSRTLDAMVNLAQMKHMMLHSDEAIALLNEVCEIRKRKLGIEHPDTLRAMTHLGNVLASTETRYAEAEPVLRQVLQATQNNPNADVSQRLLAQLSLAKVLGRLGRAEEAEPLFRESLDAAIQQFGAEHPLVASYALSYGGFLLDQKRYQEAEVQCLLARRISSNPQSPNPMQEALALNRLIKIADALGKHEDARGYRSRLAQVRPTTTATTTATAPTTTLASP